MEAHSVLHPSADALRAFALGKLNDATAAVVINHLDSCPDCCKQVAALSGDEFLQRLRQAHSRGSTPAPAKLLTNDPYVTLPPGQTSIPNPLPELADNPQYEIVRELGRGGMGVVYLAHNKLMDRREVLKVVNKALLDHPGAVERFLREIRAAAKLSHANIVTAHSAVQQGELLAFAMEYVEGQDLASLVKTQGPLPIANACFYVQQAALGLQHAYEKQMVHRDIKPQNLILAREGKKHIVKVLDFGLAKVMREKAEDTGLTGEGKMLGTPDYIAPEQALDAAKADIRADIYSLGCTLYYLLSGRAPFSGNSLSAVLMAHQMHEAKPLNLVRPEVPEELAAVARKMMAKSPAKRYQTPREVVQALSPFIKPGAAPKSAPELSVSPVEPKPAVKKAVRVDRPPAPAEPTDTEESPPKSGERAAEPLRSEKFSDLTIGSQLGQSLPTITSGKRKAVRKRPRAARMTAAWKKWLIGGGVGVGVLLLVLLGMWASGVFTTKVKTTEGILIVEANEPNSEVFVDGAKVTVSWHNGGNKTEILVKPGAHTIEVKKDGFSVDVTELTFKEGDKVIFKARLQPEKREAKADAPPSERPPQPPEQAPKETSAFFNEKDLTGWEGLPDYWQAKNGCIVGEPPPGQKAHTFLCSKKTYRDFDLKFRVKREDSIGNSGVQFRSRIKDFEKYTVVGPQCEIDALTFHFPPGSLVTEPTANPLKVMPSPTALAKLAKVYTDDDFNTFHIRCVGKHVSIEVNDIITVDDDFPSLPDEGIIAWQLHGTRSPKSVWFRIVEFTDLSASASADGFVPLFNGKDLTGWSVDQGDAKQWSAEENAIVGRSKDWRTWNYLLSDKEYADFILRFEYNIDEGSHGGVAIRAVLRERLNQGNRPYIHPMIKLTKPAMENGEKTGTTHHLKSAAINVPPVEDLSLPTRTWHSMEVIVRRDSCTAAVGGKKVVDVTLDPDPRNRGSIVPGLGRSKGKIGFQINTGTVRYRKIEIKELK